MKNTLNSDSIFSLEEKHYHQYSNYKPQKPQVSNAGHNPQSDMLKMDRRKGNFWTKSIQWKCHGNEKYF